LRVNVVKKSYQENQERCTNYLFHAESLIWQYSRKRCCGTYPAFGSILRGQGTKNFKR
jgi:hypothetical protein